VRVRFIKSGIEKVRPNREVNRQTLTGTRKSGKENWVLVSHQFLGNGVAFGKNATPFYLTACPEQ